jgi:hypothetical protein
VKRPLLFGVAGLLSVWTACHAQDTTTLVRSSELRADKRPQAPALRQLAAGEAVDLLALEGGWALVAPHKGDPQKGWVRAGVLSAAAVASVASGLRSGRDASTRGTVTLGLRGAEGPVWHGVAVLVSTPAFPGAAADLESLRQIAADLANAPSRLKILLGTDASAERVAAAVKEVAAGLDRGDGLLLYVSSRGTVVREQGGLCAEALVASGGGALTGAEMRRLLEPIAAARHPLLAIYDASFARAPRAMVTEGVQTPADEGRVRARYTPPQTSCATEQSFADEAGAPLRHRDQVQIAYGGTAHALDDSEKGGLLTQFFRDCLLREARQGPAPPSAQEVQACLAPRIAQRLQGVPSLAAQPLLDGDGTLPLEPLGATSPLR